jgi:membrane protease YdiL (CAAX protease family)
MRNSVRLLTGVGMGLGVYFLALRGIPAIPLVKTFVSSRAWVSRGDITQMVLLASSGLLMYVLSGGPTADYGFQAVPPRKVVRPVLVSSIVGFAIMVVAVLWAMGGGTGDIGRAEQQMPGGALKMILSVWILGSICEEVFFRGLLMGFLAPLKTWGIRLLHTQVSAPVAVCALLFGLGHVPLVSVVGPRMTVPIVTSATVLGFIAGYYRERTGSLLPAIAAHMTFNVVGAIVASVITAIRMRGM